MAAPNVDFKNPAAVPAVRVRIVRMVDLTIISLVDLDRHNNDKDNDHPLPVQRAMNLHTQEDRKESKPNRQVQSHRNGKRKGMLCIFNLYRHQQQCQVQLKRHLVTVTLPALHGNKQRSCWPNWNNHRLRKWKR
jgi:hypothetical protein